MRITSRSTIAAHILACIDYFKGGRKIASESPASDAGANPVIIRTVPGKLK